MESLLILSRILKRLLNYFDCLESANENQQGEILKLCELDYISRLPDSLVQQGEMLKMCELDYISRLPDSVVHHIFSLLPPRDVASTSVLSRTWNNCWCRYPYAIFNFIYYSYYPTEQNDRRWALHKQKFLDLIERAVLRRLGGEFYLQRFQMYLEFSDLPLLEPYLNQWISIAIGKGVPEFALRVDIGLSGGLQCHYSVPQVVLQAESLKVLSLSGCTFRSGFDVRLPHLKKFSLHRCEFEDELSFHVLISGCPMIEYVKISDSKWMCKTLSLMNLPRLKHFEFLRCKDIDNVEIYATNLQTFSFAAASSRWPRRFELNSCKALRELKIVGVGLSFDFVPEHLISQLPSLEVLEFDEFFTDSQDLVISSHRLKRLAFRKCHGLHITADTPNLQSLENCYCGKLFIPINVSTILNVHLIFDGQSTYWLTRLANFLSTRSSMVDLKLVIYHKLFKNMIIHEKLSDISFLSLYHFMFDNYICISSRSYTDLMNELIPTVYPKHVYLIHTRDEFVKALSEKIKNVSCNPLLLHKLVGFKVNTHADVEDRVEPVTLAFIEKYSIPPYRDSVLSLDWRRRDVSGRKVLL